MSPGGTAMRVAGRSGKTTLCRCLFTRFVLGGNCNFGVESTARQATGRGFAVVVVEDACTSLDVASHRFTFEEIFPRLGRVRKADEVISALM